MLVLEFHALEKVESILAAEQEGFNQTDLPALNGRDFTACILSLVLKQARDTLLTRNGTSSTIVPDLAVFPLPSTNEIQKRA